MADLVLTARTGGLLRLRGPLHLRADGGVVTVDGDEVLVEGAEGTAPAVIQPPPPSSPADPGQDVEVVASLNRDVTAHGEPVVTQGMVLQGDQRTWPGMVLPSQANEAVLVGPLAVNVVGDRAAIFPSGAVATLTDSGQQT